MTVKAIIAMKGSDVVSVNPEMTLSEAAKLLALKRIGAVLVLTDEEQVAGILSERDIVRAFAELGAQATSRKVTEIMTKKVESCKLSETISEIMERMTRGKFRHMPVIEDGKLAGVISIGDVVKHRLHEMEQEQEALREYILTA